MDKFSTRKVDASEQFYIEQYARKYNDPGCGWGSEVYQRLLSKFYEAVQDIGRI